MKNKDNKKTEESTDIINMKNALYKSIMSVLKDGDEDQKIKTFSVANSYIKNYGGFERDISDVGIEIIALPNKFDKEALNKEVSKSTKTISDKDLKDIIDG